MGFTKNALDLCNEISSEFRGACVLSLGNPFIENQILKSSKTSKVNKNKIISLENNIRSSFLFEEIYKVNKFDILDVSNKEGAEYIHDLNDLINDNSILNKYDFVLDLGTQEHVFNTNIFLSNVFNLLKNTGYYIFNLPANGDLEHGFRQYSPTFFYDLCYANNDFLSIEWLSLHSKMCALNMLPLYKSLEKDSSKTISYNFNNLNNLASNNGFLTASSISLLNKLASQVSVLGVIKKKDSKELNFKVSQCLYRNVSLEEAQVKENIKLSSLNTKSIIKTILFNFPLPSSIKFKLLTLIFNYIFKNFTKI